MNMEELGRGWIGRSNYKCRSTLSFDVREKYKGGCRCYLRGFIQRTIFTRVRPPAERVSKQDHRLTCLNERIENLQRRNKKI